MIKRKFSTMLIFLFSLLTHRSNGQPSTYSFQANKMGTEFNIKVIGNDSIKIAQAVTRAWLRIDSLNEIFSDYSHTSELARLHQDTTGKMFVLSADLACLLHVSLKYSKLSHGAFDVSVGSLTKIWRRAVKLNEFPDSLKIREALRHVGYQKIILTKNLVKLPRGMRLDFGAIAKGYAADAAWLILKSAGYPISLVDGGGDIYCGSSPPGKKGWEVSMQVKDLHGEWKDSIVYIHDASIVTSGDAYKYIEDPQGHRYSHIINPVSGYGIAGPHLTTVIAENGMHADALATTLSVMKKSQLKTFLKNWKLAFPDMKKKISYLIYRAK